MQQSHATRSVFLQSDVRMERLSSRNAHNWGGISTPSNKLTSSLKSERLSSSPSSVGMPPVSWLFWSCNPLNRKHEPSSEGIDPLSLLWFSDIILTSSSLPNSVGIVPSNLLSRSERVMISVNRPRPGGRVPSSWFESRMRVSVRKRGETKPMKTNAQ